MICKLTEGALKPFTKIIDKNIKQIWHQYLALENTTDDQLPTGLNCIQYASLTQAIRRVLHPDSFTPVQAMSRQFLQENMVGKSIKSPIGIQVNNISIFSLIY